MMLRTILAEYGEYHEPLIILVYTTHKIKPHTTSGGGAPCCMWNKRAMHYTCSSLFFACDPTLVDYTLYNHNFVIG